MSDGKDDPGYKRRKEELKKILADSGVDIDKVRREADVSLLMPKMAVLGCAEAALRFIESLKNQIISGGVSPNLPLIRFYLKAISSTVVTAEDALATYEFNSRKLAEQAARSPAQTRGTTSGEDDYEEEEPDYLDDQGEEEEEGDPGDDYEPPPSSSKKRILN